MKDGTFLQQLIGTTDMTAYAVSFTLALIGAFISLRIQAHKRDKTSPNTPVKFSPGFMFMDNLNRIMLTVCLIFVGLRFSKEIFGQETTEYGAILIGLGLDKVSEFLKNMSLKARG